MNIAKSLLAALLMASASLPALATDMSDAKKKDIEQIIGLSLQSRMVNQMLGAALTRNMAKLKERYPDATEEEITRTFSAEATRTGGAIWARLYDAHFTEAEIKDILAFYQSSAGRKFETAIPQMLQEIQKEVQAEMPALQQRVDAALLKGKAAH